jgi:hypothetical protein
MQRVLMCGASKSNRRATKRQDLEGSDPVKTLNAAVSHVGQTEHAADLGPTPVPVH